MDEGVLRNVDVKLAECNVRDSGVESKNETSALRILKTREQRKRQQPNTDGISGRIGLLQKL